MSTVRVKICGITRGVDLQAAVAAGADALGFVFAQRSKRVLEPQQATDLVANAPAFVSRVGLFMDQGIDTISSILDQVPLNLLQFHGQESGGFCRRFGLPYIKAISMQSGLDVQRVADEYGDAAALLLDSHQPGGVGGTGQVFDWSAIPELPIPVILAGGLTAANVRQAVEQVKPWAVDVSSGVEDAPGRKNADQMREFIREAKREY
jgi:phosphoribosylanthranilate isomerase